MMKRTTQAILAGTALLGLAACGGGGGGGDATAAPTPTPTPTMAPTPTPPPQASVCDETFVTCSGNNAVLAGTVDKDLTLTSEFTWILDGFVFIGEGAEEITSEAQATALRNNRVTLTIPAGTTVQATDDGTLIVTRGGRINANGTATNPITFRSINDPNFTEIGAWGGVVLQGFAQQFGLGGTGVCHNNTQTYCNVVGEGGAGFHGGNDDADNSGVFRYVRLAGGGLVAGPNNEINGLTLQSVGHSTVVEYVQIHNNQDDAIEWFGGTANVRYLVLTGNDDDDIDFDQGWRGNVQFALAIKSNNATPIGSNDPRGIEANSSDDEFVPETRGSLANITLIGGNMNNAPGQEEPAMRLRGSVKLDLYNSVAAGYDLGCVRIDDSNTTGSGVDDFSVVNFINVIGDCAGGFYQPGRRAADNETGVVGARSVTFDQAYALDSTNGLLGAATAIQPVDNGSGFAFEATDYVGAVRPGTAASEAWFAGWTLPGTLRFPVP